MATKVCLFTNYRTTASFCYHKLNLLYFCPQMARLGFCCPHGIRKTSKFWLHFSNFLCQWGEKNICLPLGSNPGPLCVTRALFSYAELGPGQFFMSKAYLQKIVPTDLFKADGGLTPDSSIQMYISAPVKSGSIRVKMSRAAWTEASMLPSVLTITIWRWWEVSQRTMAKWCLPRSS